MLYDSNRFEEWEARLAEKKIVGVCRDGEHKWRAYLHIGSKQVWQKRGFRWKAEAANARMEAEQRYHMRKLAVKGADRRKDAIRTPNDADFFEGVRPRPDGTYEAYRMVKAPPAQKSEVRFVEQSLGIFAERSLAFLCVQASIGGIDFDKTFFKTYLEMHEQAEKLRRDMLEFSQKTLIPLLQLAPSKGKKRKVYRSILGYRWEQVRRYKTKTIYTSSGPEKVKELSGVYLRLVKEKE